MFKQRICLLALSCLACTTGLAQSDESEDRVASNSERIARARWQPIRQPVDEAVDELPGPEPFESEIAEGEGVAILEGEHGGYYDERYRNGDYYGPRSGGSYCDDCGDYPCRPKGWNPLFCLCIPNDGWVSAEYMMMWQKGMRLPPLVTTSNQADAARLGRSSTTTLFGGGNGYVDDLQNGLRVRLGFWLDPCHNWAIEAEHFGLESNSDGFSATGDGTTVIGRPFFNMQLNAQDAELVSFPNTVSGTVSANVTSSLNSTGIHLRRLLCCGQGCVTDCCCRSRPYCSRLEGLVGWRRMHLDEDLTIREDLTAANNAGTFDITDSFHTDTHFNGFNFGVLYHRQRGRWSLDMTGRLGIGTNRQIVSIGGQTLITQTGAADQSFNEGIYALSTNSGRFSRNRFAVIPEFGFTTGYNWTSNLRFTLGYTFIYWNNVVRPGDQIDQDLNPNLFPPAIAGANVSSRPTFAFQETDYWVQGWTIGAEYRF